jgi:L-fuconolactonase
MSTRGSITHGSSFDSHVHIWDPTQFAYPWLAQAAPRLHRTFTLEDAEKATPEHRFVLVQAAHSIAESKWLLGQASTSTRVAGVVGWVDIHGDALLDLAEIDIAPALLGIRVDLRSRHATFTEHNLTPLITELHQRQLTIELLASPTEYSMVAHLADGGTFVVIDHAWHPPPSLEELGEWRAAVRNISAHPQVVLKWSGSWLRHSSRAREAIAGELLEHIGPSRLIYGSDWPVTRLSNKERTWATEVLGDAALETKTCSPLRAYPRLTPVP